jgi:tetratricopeptide (TPR) repeat protein
MHLRHLGRHVIVVGFLLALAVRAAAQVPSRGLEAFREGNRLYQLRDDIGAIPKYEETIALCKGSASDCTDPQLTPAYVFLGHGYARLFRPTQRGDAYNDSMLTRAIDNYKKSVSVETDPKIRRLALEHLVAAYGPDKLNQRSQAVPILRRMIELEPNERTKSVYLSLIYEAGGEYAQAEQLLIKAAETTPSDPSVYVTLAAFHNRQGAFDKAMRALVTRAEREPNSPEAFYTIATYYWEKAYEDVTVPEAQKLVYVRAGLAAIDRALSLRSDYVEALVYKGLLLRVQAVWERDRARQELLLKEADRLRDEAREMSKRREGWVVNERPSQVRASGA